MADFRRWYLALAVPLLFVGTASAQVGTQSGSTPLACTAQATTTPTIREEGITEEVGDILITCTGGTIYSNLGNGGSSNPAAQLTNITVTLGQPITSRLVNSSNVSEALLMIDEPNSGESAPIPGFGPQEGFKVCPSPTTGCAGSTYILTQTATGGTLYQTAVSTSTQTSPAPATATTYNTFQGVVTGSQVTFFGVPIVPPGTTGERVFRITNVRVNASGYATNTPVQAFVSVTGLTITNPQPVVAYVQKSLSGSVGGSPIPSFGQCNSITSLSASPNVAQTVTFTEAFANAFKTRVDASVTGQTSTAGTFLQNIPGRLYNSESGFTLLNGETLTNASGSVTGLTGSAQNGGVGLADTGTRLTAVFSNLPTSGVRIFVSATNVSGSTGVTAGSAQAVSSETVADSNGFVPSPALYSTVGGVGVVEITPSSGSTTTTATWEVTTAYPNQVISLTFNVYILLTASPSTNSPAAGTVGVDLRYGPVGTGATTASQTAPIPRFVDLSTAPTNLFSVGLCRSILLFPFVTNAAGFDTGIAIANTSTDTISGSTATPQNGTCTLNWFGSAAPSAATNTPTITSGTDYATLASVNAPGFQGYMIAICNFQYAHGFAFVDTAGLNGVAVGYLADVIPDPALVGGRFAAPPSPAVASGENLGQ